MHEKTSNHTSIGGTKAAVTVEKSAVGRRDSGSPPSPSTPTSDRPDGPAPGTGNALAQTARKDRLRETRGSNPIVMVTAGLVLVAAAVAVYFTVA